MNTTLATQHKNRLVMSYYSICCDFTWCWRSQLCTIPCRLKLLIIFVSSKPCIDIHLLRLARQAMRCFPVSFFSNCQIGSIKFPKPSVFIISVQKCQMTLSDINYVSFLPPFSLKLRRYPPVRLTVCSRPFYRTRKR